MRYLTEEEEKSLDLVIHKAKLGQLFRCLWWTITNNKKIDILFQSLKDGMSWEFAYKNAKKYK
jgi:hypothetical protein